MWHWIQSALSKKRQQFFFDILILVTCIHVFIIACAMFYQGKRGLEQISLVAPDLRGSTLVFVPLYKKIEQPPLKSSTNSVQKPHHMMNYDEFLERQKKAASVPKKPSVKAGSSKTGLAKTVAEKKSVVPKSVQKAQVQKKAELKKDIPAKTAIVKPVERKSASVQKVDVAKSVVATSMSDESVKSKKTPVKKNVETQALVQKKDQKILGASVEKNQAGIQEKEIEKQVEKIEPAVGKEAIQEIVEPQTVEESAVKNVQEESVLHEAGAQENVLPLIDMNDVTFVGVKDLEHLQLQQLVSGQLAKHWKRPVGMEKKMCVVKVELLATGKILNVHIEKSSGVPMYDMAAKAAALKTIYPQEIWNKKLVIQF